ncbi:MAG: SUF system Fe-S cluster assembly protein [Pseudomonadota bacterium]
MLGFKRKKKPKVDLKPQVIAALKTIYDPEIPVNIYDLGLIYDVAIDEQANVQIQMTLTAPGCPVAQTFPQMVENGVKSAVKVNSVNVELVWEPPWDQSRMSEAAKLQLGLI